MTTISEKRANETDDVCYKANIVLVDIEGTTTSIDFVKNTLFPYVRKNLEVYLKAKWNDDEFKEDLKLLQEQSKKDEADGTEGLVKIPEGVSEDICEDVKKNILWQMDLDRKTKALKQLQGHIWRDAYKKGEVKAHVYPDVAPALKSWKQSGKDIYVYSSGSVEAQKLLFGHTENGDLLEIFSGFFDTTVGPKVEESSYSNIVKSVKCKSEEIIFFTDVPKEARAAKSAGLQAVIVIREGNLPITDEDKLEFPIIKCFDDIVFETSVKRRKKSEEEPLEQGKTNSAVIEVSDVQDVEMQEESIAVKSEASKATEGVSSTAEVEDVDVQPDSMKQTPVEQSTTGEEAKQTVCKDKDTLNNDLASTKQTDSELVVDQGDTEGIKNSKSNETDLKNLEVNGAEKLDTDSDKKRTENNGPKCPKDNHPKTDANNSDTPIKTSSDGPINCNNDTAGNTSLVPDKVDIVVPDSETDTKLSAGDKSKLNDKTETRESDSKISGSSVPSGKTSKESLSSDNTADSKSKVESLKDKTVPSLPNTADISNKTEFTHTDKTENVCAKTECATTYNTETALTCKNESRKPIDAEPVITKTESEVNKTESEVNKTESEVNKTESEVRKTESGVRKTESEVNKTESEVNKTEPMETDDLTPTSDLKPASTNEDEPMEKDKTEVTHGVEPLSGVKTDNSLATDEKVKVASPVAPSAADGGKVEVVPVSGKAEVKVDVAPAGGKAEAHAVSSKSEAGAVSSKSEAGAVSSKSEAGAVSSKSEAGAVSSKSEAGAVSSKSEAGAVSSKADVAMEAAPAAGKAEAAPAAGKVEAAPAAGKAEAAVGATTVGGTAETAVETTPVDGKANVVAKADSSSGSVQGVAEAAPVGCTAKMEAVSNTGGKAEAADLVEDGKVASDAKADAGAPVGKVKGDNESGVPKQDIEPMLTDELVPADRAKPVVEDESEPMVTDEVEPMETDETKPVTEGVNHTTTNAEPMVTEGPEPIVTNKETSTVLDGDSEKLKTAQPKKDTAASEDNVPSVSPHVDNANCNAVNEDIAVKDTNDFTTTRKPDAVLTEKGDGEISDTKTESSKTENKTSKTENENDVDNVEEKENDIKEGKTSINSCVENGESAEKTDNNSEKLKVAAESADKVSENVSN